MHKSKDGLYSMNQEQLNFVSERTTALYLFCSRGNGWIKALLHKKDGFVFLKINILLQIIKIIKIIIISHNM